MDFSYQKKLVEAFLKDADELNSKFDETTAEISDVKEEMITIITETANNYQPVYEYLLNKGYKFTDEESGESNANGPVIALSELNRLYYWDVRERNFSYLDFNGQQVSPKVTDPEYILRFLPFDNFMKKLYAPFNQLDLLNKAQRETLRKNRSSLDQWKNYLSSNS